MSKSFKVPFAFDDNGTIVDIINADKGTVYKCSCGADLKLRGGEIISNHFYHIDESECSLESSIHKAYKSVFESIKKVKLPYDVNGTDLLIFDKVDIEKKIDDYIPDAIGYINDRRYIIEFAKSSYIGDRKLSKIKKSNIFCIEIDIVKTTNTIDEIRHHIGNDTIYKHILHIPEYEEMTTLREVFRDEYRKLQIRHGSEMQLLRNRIFELEQRVGFFDEIKDDCTLFFKADCKNGAKMYKRDMYEYGKEIVAFQKGGVINVKFHT